VKPIQLKAVLAIIVISAAGLVDASDLAGKLTIGVKVDDPKAVLDSLVAEPPFDEGELFFVSWTVPLDGSADMGSVDAIRNTGAQPWVRVVFTSPAPLIGNLDRLEGELAALAAIVQTTGDNIYVQAQWNPESGATTAKDHAYLYKRAAVVVTGAAAGAGFAAGPLPSDPALLEELYAEEVAAYLDALVLAPGEEATSAMDVLAVFDPGKPVVVDAVAWPDPTLPPMGEVAAWAAAGAAMIFVEADLGITLGLRSLKVAARELSGGLVHDPISDPSGGGGAWTFVREDLGLRVVAKKKAGERRLRLVFADDLLRSPELVDLKTGEARSVTGIRFGGEFVVVVDDAPDVVLLRLERPSAAELEGFDEEIEIGGGRQMPVGEILRRLQAFEDDQDRRLRHFQAKRNFHMRFQSQQGSMEVTYVGEYFYRSGVFDWVWSDFYVGGVKWRSKKLPKLPLIQPEKVASLPTEIHLAKDYQHRLRGTAVIDGRDCWVIDFKPLTVAPGRSLFQGTVWVDREVYARVRTRAVQVGLEGDVLSNEETFFFSPLDELGRPAPWSSESYILPLRISGQQVFSILNVTVPVEIDTRLTEIRINGEDFDDKREAALASDATILRDTEDGLRYLRKDKSGKRVIETGFDSSRLFLVGGVFWDASVDYPLPLVGVDYVDLDFKDSGAQLNVFFAGAFLSANIADPDFLGSRWNAGANFNGVFFKARDELYRDGVVVPEEEIRQRSGTFNLFAGHPFAKFFSFNLKYRLNYQEFDKSDNTAADFVLPQSTFTHIAKVKIDYNRSGYSVAVAGSHHQRSNWEFWGLPDNTEYSPDQKDYQRWQFNVAKSWWLKDFRKINLALEYLDSADTDRFSGYDFGLFGGASVAGYPSGLVRAEKAVGGHLSGGVNYLDLIRLTAKADAMWATNRVTGLDQELLAGIGIGGTLTLPWQLIMNFEFGYALTGPGKGDIAVRVFFLKLSPGS